MMKRLDHKETMTFLTILLSFNLFTTCSKNESSHEIVPVNFVKSTQVFDSLTTFQTALADLDKDGDLDLVFSINGPDGCRVLFNDGKGYFTESDQRLTDQGHGVGIGDLDIFACDMGKGYRTLLNDGGGNFHEHWSHPDTSLIRCFRGFGDIDNDDDIDVIVTNGNRRHSHPTKILFNDGTGRFEKGEQTLSPVLAGRVGVGDVNQDGHQDIVLTSYRRPNEIWLNNGKGKFTKSLELENNGAFHTALLEDIDSDGDLDLIIANYSGGSNEIWFNRKK